MNVPKLRFKGFNNEWEQNTLNNVAELINGRAYSKEEFQTEGKYPVLRVGNFFTNDGWYYSDLELEQNKYADNGDLLYAWSASFGPKIWNGEKVIYHYHIWKVLMNEYKISKKFLYSWFIYDANKLLSQKNGSTMVHITKNNMENRNIYLPQLNEQDKIGEFFNKIELKIQFQQKKIDLLQAKRRGYLQKIFNQEVKFKDSNGQYYPKWKIAKLSNYAKKIVAKNKDIAISNVITNSAKNGLIAQKDFFNKEIANKENIDGYYIISQGDFVYNPRISADAPYGPINIYKENELGIVSPLYMCFSIENIQKEFMYYYFKSTLWYKYIYMHGDSGARHDRVSIKDSTFLEMPISIPCKEEQLQIANFFSKLEKKIAFEEKKLKQLLAQKKSLMQQMFI
ncbi:MAG: hypothetical protein K0S51_2419 [Bacillales bacterium]|jgi:restriction endonuclease S subunit|nr:hypothetical protein [Bacillales bacterium]